jgi:hypothetical protein
MRKYGERVKWTDIERTALSVETTNAMVNMSEPDPNVYAGEEVREVARLHHEGS